LINSLANSFRWNILELDAPINIFKLISNNYSSIIFTRINYT